MFTSVLIANRGEIACRVIRTCQAQGIRAIAVYSDADANALHVRLADAAYNIGPAPARDSYLNIAAIVLAARKAHAQAIHPGYGFLAENAVFAEAVTRAGFTFIGPGADALGKMGRKTAARDLMRAAGVPVVPGFHPAHDTSNAVFQAAALDIGFPVLIKAAAGGGGKGMRLAQNGDDFEALLGAARREALAAFGDDTVYLERCIARPRHIEFQIFGDGFGQVIHLNERECSIQRRHQKVVEETPSPFLTPALRAQMAASAVAAARAVGYVNAGTVEFIVDPGGAFYFLEMNTRLQVEHPITELTTGVDLVALQLAIAAGEPLPEALLEGAPSHGHAIECRVCAEDAANGFLPATGVIAAYREPEGEGIRVDSGVARGDEIGLRYDALLAKLIVHAPTRAAAIEKMTFALDNFVIEGLVTNLAFLREVITHPAFAAGETTTDFIDRHFGGEPAAGATQTITADPTAAIRNPWQIADGYRIGAAAPRAASTRAPTARNTAPLPAHPPARASQIVSPMPGLVVDVPATLGARVARGATLVVLEAMKMEYRLVAPADGIVNRIGCAKGETVQRGQILIELGLENS
ncbi:MAG: acetyl-CoA carboxylase biotin carboxylase subunit [Anaerolineae bacterium]|nr:acetyl-CoA carboxylase biotin carboxylase subunit [Anaerolineae bacterium]